jgi:homospermidine synthase
LVARSSRSKRRARCSLSERDRHAGHVSCLGGHGLGARESEAGIVEADELDFRRCLEVQIPYLGPVVGVYTDWTPLANRPGLFPEDIDQGDPWQFKNVLVR